MTTSSIPAVRTILGDPAAEKMELPVVKQWFADRGDQTLRLEYPLTEKSIVLDAGGYEGNWAAEIDERYKCIIHIFEPVPAFADNIRARFAHRPNIHIHAFGLSDRDAAATIHIDNDATSVHKGKGTPIQVQLKCATDVIAELLPPHTAIDLIKINIEGCEYELLEHLIATQTILKFCNIQVQFHDFVPNAPCRMAAIQKSLATTHELQWQYRFVWENWQRA
jgi:FkbM family methyltransferase